MAPGQTSNGESGQGAMLHLGLFFDGTRNNAHNLARGRPQPPQPRPALLRADDDSTYQSRLTSSYDNGTTNIARLHQLYPDSRRAPLAEPSLAIYVEGVGTRDDAEDDLIGLAFGIGASGVRAKVQRALHELLPAALSALAAHWQQPLHGVQVDLFGFSRGAAAARDLANQLHGWDAGQWRLRLQGAGLPCAADFAL
ncbi:MAG TPA: type IV secretion protein Rhs, partial [Stenotrophomonas sp.]|nr:type IV secretion protein Rhs [Stenotrophomonas sp.]